MAARIEDDPQPDGRRAALRAQVRGICLPEKPRGPADITVTWLMSALGRSRRTVQRYLRQLERAGYITVEVIHARTRMCAGLSVALLIRSSRASPAWPEKLIEPDAPQMSQNNKLKAYKTKYSRDHGRCAAWTACFGPL